MHVFQALDRILLAPLGRLATAIAELGLQIHNGLEWLYYLRVQFWLVEGEEQNSKLPLSILCGLRGETKNYLLRLIYGDCYRQRSLGRFWVWNVAKAIPAAGSGCSMIVLWRCDSQRQRFARPSDWFLLPDWVLGEVTLPRDAKATHKVRRDLQKIRHHALRFEVTRDPRQFDDFYHHMYVPYTSQAFGNQAYVYSHKVVKRWFRSGDLLLVMKGTESLAGVLISYDGATPHLFLMGVRNGEREGVRSVAGGSVVSHFGLQYLQEKGYKQAWLGWSRPFLRDGVLRFKRRWSQVITGSRSWGFGLRVLSPTPAAKSFLRNNPFIFKRDGLLYAAVFVDADRAFSPEEIREMTKDYFHEGLSGMIIYCLPPDGAAASTPAVAELPDRVEMRGWPP